MEEPMEEYVAIQKKTYAQHIVLSCLFGVLLTISTWIPWWLSTPAFVLGLACTIPVLSYWGWGKGKRNL